MNISFSGDSCLESVDVFTFVCAFSAGREQRGLQLLGISRSEVRRRLLEAWQRHHPPGKQPFPFLFCVRLVTFCGAAVIRQQNPFIWRIAYFSPNLVQTFCKAKLCQECNVRREGTATSKLDFL